MPAYRGPVKRKVVKRVAGKGKTQGPPTPKPKPKGPTPKANRGAQQPKQARPKYVAGPPTPAALRTPAGRAYARDRAIAEYRAAAKHGPEQPKAGPPTPNRVRSKDVPLNPYAQHQTLRKWAMDTIRNERSVSDERKRLLLREGYIRKNKAIIPALQKNKYDLTEKVGGIAYERQEALRNPKSAGFEKAVEAPVQKALEQTTRPLHAIMNAAKADVEAIKAGKSPIGNASYKDFIKGLTLEERTTGSDVLKAAGVGNKYVRAGGGFLLDIFGDPISISKVSRLSPKQQLQREARQAETEAAKAAAKGKTRKATRKHNEAQKKKDQAANASDSKGVQVGLSGKVPFGPRIDLMTKGRASSKAGKRLEPVAERARQSAPVRAVNAAVRPTARPGKVTREAHEATLYATRRRRAKVAAGDRKAYRRGMAYAKFKADDAKVVAAVERAAVKPLAATKKAQRKTEAHKAVTAAERRVKVAERKVAKERGRAEILRAQARRNKTVFTPPPRLVAAQNELAEAREVLTAVREAAKGKKSTVRVLVDAKTGKPYKEAMAGAARRDVDDLAGRDRDVAAQVRSELDDLKARQQAAGVLGAERQSYFPHRLTPEIQRAMQAANIRATVGGRSMKNPYTSARSDPRPIAEINYERAQKGKAPLFSEDVAPTMADYTKRSERALAQAEFLSEIKSVGRPLAGNARLADGEALYEITPTGMREIKPRSADGFSDAELARMADNGDVTVLPRAVGDMAAGERSPTVTAAREAVRLLNRPVQWWKTMVTVGNIGFYQLRNVYDEAFRSWQGDATGRSFMQATRAVKNLALLEKRLGRQLTPADVKGTIKIGGQEMPLAKFLDEAVEDGAVRTGFFASSDLPEEMLSKATSRLRHVQPVQKLRQWTQNMEDIPRLANYLAARDRGYTRREAAGHVRLYNFDYDELTEIERGIRLVVPFYTYARKNTALQAQMLVSRPGKLAAVEKLRLEANALGTDNDEYRASVARLQQIGALTPEQAQRALAGDFEAYLTEKDKQAVPILVDGNLVYPPLGITDLNRIPLATTWTELGKLAGTQRDLFLQMLGPHVKLPLEIGLNYSFFFRDAVWRDKDNPEKEHWVPAPKWARQIPGVKSQLVVRRDKNTGKKSLQWPAKLDYMLRSIGPQLNLATALGTPEKTSRGQTAAMRVFTQASGIRVVDFEHRMIAGALERTFDELGEVRVKLADMRDLEQRADPNRPSFNSTAYQKLVDREQDLVAVTDRLRAAQLGLTELPEPQTIESRPKSYEEQLREKYSPDALRDKYDPKKLYEKYQRDADRTAIEMGQP